MMSRDAILEAWLSSFVLFFNPLTGEGAEELGGGCVVTPPAPVPTLYGL